MNHESTRSELQTDEIVGRAIVSSEALPLSQLSCVPMPPPTRVWRALLLESGRRVLVAAACESWLFFWLIDIDGGKVSRRVSLPAPEWLAGSYDMSIDGDTLWVFGRDDVLEIRRSDWRVLSWRHLADLLPEDDVPFGEKRLIEATAMLPGSSYLWVKQSIPYGAYVIDLRTWTLVHPLLEVGAWTVPVLGSVEPLFLCPEVEEGPQLYRIDGTAVAGSDLAADHGTLSFEAAPIGGGFLTLELEEIPIGDGDINQMTLSHRVLTGPDSFRIAAQFQRRAREGSWDRALNRLTVSREEKLCFMLIDPWRNRDRKHLLAVSVSEAGLRLRYRARMPFDTVLLQHPKAPRVVAIFTDGQGLRVLPLGREKPELGPLPEDVFGRDWLFLPNIEIEPYSCIEPPGKDGYSAVHPLRETIRPMSKRQRRGFLGHYEATLGEDVDEMISLYFALSPGRRRSEGDPKVEEQDQVFRLLLRRFAEHPVVALISADREALAGNLKEARRWLKAAEAGQLEEYHRCHLHHLLGMVLLHEGLPDQAFAEFDQIPWDRRKSSCRLSNLPELTKPMADPPAADEWSSDQPMVRQHLGAIRTANRALEAGDPEAALAALDRPVFWQIGEIQILARLATAYLETPARSEAERFGKRYTFAYFRENLRNRVHGRHIRLPGVTWDDDRILRIEERILDWLHGDQAT